MLANVASHVGGYASEEMPHSEIWIRGRKRQRQQRTAPAVVCALLEPHIYHA